MAARHSQQSLPGVIASGERITDWRLGRLQFRPSHVPAHWELVPIVTVARLESGHTPSRKRPEYWNGNIPWVSLHDTKRLDVQEIYETQQSITQRGLDNSSARLLPRGTVIFSRTATVGKCTVMGREMATSQDFANYVCGPKLHNHYLVQLFRHLEPEWQRLKAGSTHSTVYMPVFEQLQILLPPIDEQKKIAAILSSIDAVIEKTKGVIEQLQVVKQTIMEELLTSGLPGRHTRFKKTELGAMPEGWTLCPIDELAPIGDIAVRTGPFGSSLKTKDFHSTGHPVMTIQSLGEGEVLHEGLFFVSEEKAAELAEYAVRPNDLVFSRVADIGRCAAIREAEAGWLISSNLSRIRLSPDKANAEFLSLLITTAPRVLRQVEMVSGGAGRRVITSTTLRKLLLPMPTLEEQLAIAATGRSIDDRVRSESTMLAQLQAAKFALMSVLLAGDLRVRLEDAA